MALDLSQFWRLDGKLGRRSYLLGWLAVFGLQLLLMVIPPVGMLASAPLNAVVALLMAKRLRHIGVPGRTVLLVYIPFVGYISALLWYTFMTLSGFTGSRENILLQAKLVEAFEWVVPGMLVLQLLLAAIPGEGPDTQRKRADQ